jgi:hypothetical protein
MSINIPEKILRVSKPVNVEIDFSKFSKIQMNKIPKMLRSRKIKGDAPPAIVARHLLVKHGVGFFDRSTYERRIRGFTPEDWETVQPYLELVSVEARLDPVLQEQEIKFSQDKAANEWMRDQPSPLERFDEMLERRGDNISFYWNQVHLYEFVKDRVTLPVVPELDAIAKQFENGEITTMTILATSCF